MREVPSERPHRDMPAVRKGVGAMTDTCRSCGRPILWAKVHITETPIPLDPNPRPDGNIILRPKRPYVEVATTTQIKEAKKNSTDLYVTHFATCPNAEKHRRRT